MRVSSCRASIADGHRGCRITTDCRAPAGSGLGGSSTLGIALSAALDRHTSLSAYYSRSLRFRTDTAAIGVTYVLRPAPATEDTTMNELFR